MHEGATEQGGLIFEWLAHRIAAEIKTDLSYQFRHEHHLHKGK